MIFLQTFCRFTMLLRSFIKISFVFLICSCVVIVDISFNKHVYCIKSDFEYKDCYNSTKLKIFLPHKHK